MAMMDVDCGGVVGVEEGKARDGFYEECRGEDGEEEICA
jgi:hypothetical protein